MTTAEGGVSWGEREEGRTDCPHCLGHGREYFVGFDEGMEGRNRPQGEDCNQKESKNIVETSKWKERR